MESGRKPWAEWKDIVWLDNVERPETWNGNTHETKQSEHWKVKTKLT